MTVESTRFPIIIATWQRNSREIVRVSLDRFNNCNTIDVRPCWRDTDGTFKPGRAGLTLAVVHLPKLADSLTKALQRAEVLGLLETAVVGESFAEQRQRYRRPRR